MQRQQENHGFTILALWPTNPKHSVVLGNTIFNSSMPLKQDVEVTGHSLVHSPLPTCLLFSFSSVSLRLELAHGDLKTEKYVKVKRYAGLCEHGVFQ